MEGVMRDLQGGTALVTGASGGIGKYIARALAAAGMDVVVSGRREDALAAVASEVRELGVRAEVIPADLSDVTEGESLIDRAEEALAPLDVLINNAGVELTAAFAEYTSEELTSMISINLAAPLLMTHRVVPGMLERGRGHVVFISSLAGKVGPAYEEPYAATKAALIGLTQSLRAEYLHAPIGFSVVCPGFVAGDGMYQRMVDRGIRSNRVIGETTNEKVADKVLDAIRRDRPQVIANDAPVRPLLVLQEIAPRLAERATARVGLTKMFRRAAESMGRAG
jgi:short-subunit dehydrogenase